MKKFLLTFITALMLVFTIALSGCSAETGNTSGTSYPPQPIISETSDNTPSEEKPSESGTAGTETPSESCSSVSQETNSSDNEGTTLPTPDIPDKTAYTVTVQGNIDGGTVGVDKTQTYSGDTVTLSCVPNLGYKLTLYTVTDANGNAVEVKNGKFVMPNSSVTVSGSFTLIDFVISVTQPKEGGMITVSNDTAHYQDTVSLNNYPSSGYGFDCYLVTDANGNAVEVKDGKFTMPASSVTVTGTFIQGVYNVTVEKATGGSVTASSTTAHQGETVTLFNTPLETHTFVSYTVTDANGNAVEVKDGKFTMPASNVTVTATFTAKTCTVTVTQPTGGTIKANGSTSFTVNYGTEITLSNSPLAGYLFSSYKVNNTSQTSNKYTVKSNTTITGVFNKGIGGLSASNFTDTLNTNSSATGLISVSGNSVTSSQNKYPFVYSKVQGDFYYEVEISLTSIYDNDSLPKAGIAIECNGEILFFYIDSQASGFGTIKKAYARTATGTFSGSRSWLWDSNSIYGYASFSGNYTNGEYVKLSVLRVGGLYRFSVDGENVVTSWMPNMDDTANIGIHSFNVGFNAKNAKIGTSASVIENARAYYGLNASKNPSKATNIDAQEYDWGENLVNQYGLATADGSKYFFASAFKGTDGVYVMYKAKTEKFINSGVSNWYESTNIEIYSGSEHIYASAQGHKQGITDIHFGAYGYPNTSTILISVEAKIPYSVWNASDSSASIAMSFAFKSDDPAQLNFNNSNTETWSVDEKWWCGADWHQITVTTSGLDLVRETTPTDKVVRFDGLMFSDPFMLVAGGQYFMYGTVGKNGFRVFVSDDMVNWRFPEDRDFQKWGITNPYAEQYVMDGGADGGYVYHIDWSSKSWGTTNFWAPEIIYHAKTNEYKMYYTAFYPTAGCEKIGVATAKTPLGPFIDVHDGPMLYSSSSDIGTKCIDASPFIDDDGKFWLYYSLTIASDGSSETWVIQLDEYGNAPIGSPTFCVRCEEGWEHVDKTEQACNEGAYMYKHNGKYFLTYSANTFWQPLYAVGLAVGNSPTGPFTKYNGNPIVVKDEGKSAGTGHGMIFKDTSGKLWYLFHTYRNGVSSDGGKCAMAARLWFHNGIPTIEYKNW